MSREGALRDYGVVLDETSAEALTAWIAGETPEFLEFVNEQWRLERG